MIVVNSIKKVTRLFPVPVTAFSQITEKDIKTMAVVTTRTTGIAAVIKLLSCP